MNLGPTQVSSTYAYVLNQSGANGITLGNNAAVNWDTGGVVAKTGNQNISGTKTFVSGIIASGTYNSIGTLSATNVFGATATNNYFGENAVTNDFASYGATNGFGFYGTSNDFGSYGTTNIFGSNAGANAFGDNSNINYFGGYSNAINESAFFSSTLNTKNSTINAASPYSTAIGGRNISITHSGSMVLADDQVRTHSSKGNNTLSLDFASGVYLRLPQFTGASSQTGFIGQMAVSGSYLYMYMNDSDKWRRIAITSSF